MQLLQGKLSIQGQVIDVTNNHTSVFLTDFALSRIVRNNPSLNLAVGDTCTQLI